MSLIDYAQQGDREALLLYDETLYVEVATVDDWFAREAAKGSRGEAVRNFMMEGIRKAKETRGDSAI